MQFMFIKCHHAAVWCTSSESHQGPASTGQMQAAVCSPVSWIHYHHHSDSESRSLSANSNKGIIPNLQLQWQPHKHL